MDIYETESGLVLLADVPGAKPEGLDITLDRRVLSVRAEAHRGDRYPLALRWDPTPLGPGPHAGTEVPARALCTRRSTT